LHSYTAVLQRFLAVSSLKKERDNREVAVGKELVHFQCAKRSQEEMLPLIYQDESLTRFWSFFLVRSVLEAFGKQ